MMLWGAPDGLGSFCQISSVRNGMNGCRRRIAVSSAVTSVPWILLRASRSASPSPRELLEARLGELDVPVAQLVPDEVVGGLRGVGDPILLERAVDLLGDPLHAREDPALRQIQLGAVGAVGEPIGVAIGVVALEVHQRELRGVPDLVGEAARVLDVADART